MVAGYGRMGRGLIAGGLIAALANAGGHPLPAPRSRPVPWKLSAQEQRRRARERQERKQREAEQRERLLRERIAKGEDDRDDKYLHAAARRRRKEMRQDAMWPNEATGQGAGV